MKVTDDSTLGDLDVCPTALNSPENFEMVVRQHPGGSDIATLAQKAW